MALHPLLDPHPNRRHLFSLLNSSIPHHPPLPYYIPPPSQSPTYHLARGYGEGETPPKEEKTTVMACFTYTLGLVGFGGYSGAYIGDYSGVRVGCCL